VLDVNLGFDPVTFERVVSQTETVAEGDVKDFYTQISSITVNYLIGR